MVPFSKLQSDVADSGHQRLEAWYNSNYNSVLNVAKATAGVMKNPARDLVVLLVLARLAQACQVGSIATPPNRTAKSKHFCGDLQPIQLQIPGGIPEFFCRL